MKMLSGLEDESIDLIYLDPPFNSNRDYIAFNDKWESKDVYLKFLEKRLYLMKSKLKETGSLYLHCDPSWSHYIKIMLDGVFGQHNFRNEIIWGYSGPQAPSKKRFSSKHDIIFSYSKDKNKVKTYELYHFEKERESESSYMKDESGKYFYTLPKGDYSEESIKRLDKEGRIYRTKNNKVRIKYFVEKTTDGYFLKKKKLTDVWTDIPSLGQVNSKEKTAYPTQKPLKLLERIIKASSNEGDIVLDPFMGSGTTLVAANNLNRKFIGFDISSEAVAIATDRLKLKEN